MTTSKKADHTADEHHDIAAEFKNVVNMTPKP